MNLEDAISAHAQWKVKFRAAIDRNEKVDASTIGKDNCCELGKWIYSEGQCELGLKPEFTALKVKHKAFHVEADKVAEAINAKKYSEATSMINGSSQFGIASTQVGVAISVLKKAL